MQLNTRYTSPGAELFSEFDRFFRRSLGRNRGAFRNPRESEFSLYETDQSWILRTDLPGFRKEDLTVELEDGALRIQGTRAEDSTGPNFDQTLRLPKGIQADAITARLELGVLELTLPKAQPTTPDTLRIDVN